MEDLGRLGVREVLVVPMVMAVVAVTVEDRSSDQETLLILHVLEEALDGENRDVSVRVFVSRALEDHVAMYILEGKHLENVDVHHESTGSGFSLQFSPRP